MSEELWIIPLSVFQQRLQQDRAKGRRVVLLSIRRLWRPQCDTAVRALGFDSRSQRCWGQPASSISLHPEVAQPFDLCCLFNIYCDFNAPHYVPEPQCGPETGTHWRRSQEGPEPTPPPPPTPPDPVHAITIDSKESLVKQETSSIICSEKTNDGAHGSEGKKLAGLKKKKKTDTKWIQSIYSKKG